MHKAHNAAPNTPRASTARRPGWSPPRTGSEKDQLIEKLVHDNEVLRKEVAHLDEQLRQMTVEQEAGTRTTEQLRQDQQAAEQASAMAERLVGSCERASLNLIHGLRVVTHPVVSAWVSRGARA